MRSPAQSGITLFVAFGKKRKTQNLYLDTDYTDATDFKTVIASWGPRPHYHCLRQEIDYAFDFFREADDTIFNPTMDWK
jgi:hypothetical protein